MSDVPNSPSTANGTDKQDTGDVQRRLAAEADAAAAGPRFAAGDAVPGLNSWVIERRLGGGGFGEVWLARHAWNAREQPRAIKFCTDPAARHRLVTHEKNVVLRVMKYAGDHPNVVPLLDCNLDGETPWLMYEFVEGGTLAEAVAEWRDLPPPRRLGRAVRTLRAIAGALGAFHRFDPPLVHRDLKPANVLMSGGTPRITDFGIGGVATEATLTDSGKNARVPTIIQAVGSSRYAPQEQFLGSPPSPRDDVYALGVLAYQLVLADLKAAPGPDAGAELRALKIPAELTSLIVQSVALDPEHRPADATEWETRLAALMQKKSVAGIVPAPPSDDPSDVTEPLEALSDLDVANYVASRSLAVAARGRWYSRPADKRRAEWRIVAATPAVVRVSPGESYRFSIHSAATERDVDAVRALAEVSTLTYLNLSYCAGVTDAGLAHLKEFTGLRQLFLRGCANLTDAGLAHLHGLTRLRALELTDSERLTAAAVAALQKALPKCKITR